MINPYSHKVKSREEVRDLIGPRPREKKVIMCHGTFDIVHPGHLRHLVYAKEKADILIASVTSDEFITKGPYQPFVPEALRATNLGAFEMVDYVILDRNATPIGNILFLQPDFFAKGFEYSLDGIHPNTLEETRALETYGGGILFTPGDIVYSSSALLKMHIPNLAVEKLMAAMESEGIDFGDLRRVLHQLDRLRVHVVGDTIVDKYTYCSLLGSAPKSPTFSVKQEYSELFAGGAAIVSRHVRSLGAPVIFTTMFGDDDIKDFTLKEMHESNVEVVALIDRNRPTTLKERFMVDEYRMLQVDRLDNRIISKGMLDEISDSIRASNSDVYIFSDFRHGIFHQGTIAAMKEAIHPAAFKAADSQVSSRWGNILDFQGFNLVTPNEREARFALGDQDSVIRPLGLSLFNQARCGYLILKLGDRGIIVYRGPGRDPREFFILDSFVENLVDPVGAGDSLLAMSSLALAQSGNIVIAAILGGLSAALACERQGNVPVGIADVEGKLDAIEKVVQAA